MKKIWQKIFPLLLSVLMILPMLTACKDKTPAPDSGSDSVSITEPTDQETSETEKTTNSKTDDTTTEEPTDTTTDSPTTPSTDNPSTPSTQLPSTQPTEPPHTTQQPTTPDPEPEKPKHLIPSLAAKPSSEASTAEKALTATSHLVGATDQKNNRLVVFDLNKGNLDNPDSIVWEYTDRRARQAAGIKFRYNEALGGDVVLFCGPEGAGIVRYETKELIYFTGYVGSGDNPHTVELLPDGTFLVGGTNLADPKLYFFDTLSGSKRPKYVLKWEWDVHGALWDPSYNVLWLAGGELVQAYRVSGTPAQPSIEKVPGLGTHFETAVSNVHDLQPVYGDPSKLWVTAIEGVIQLDKNNMSAHSKNFRGTEAFEGRTYTPGIGNFLDGSIVYVFPDGALNGWNTATIRLTVPYGGSQTKEFSWVSGKDAYYKIRVFCTDYQ